MACGDICEHVWQVNVKVNVKVKVKLNVCRFGLLGGPLHWARGSGRATWQSQVRRCTSDRMLGYAAPRRVVVKV